MSNNHLTTEQIIVGCRQGNAHCQKELVNRYSGLLFAVCIRYTGNEQKAKDILQDTFIRIFRSFKTFNPDKGSLPSWMKKIAVNTALKDLGKKNIQSSSLSIEIHEKARIEASALDNLMAEDLLKVIQTLPEGYRQVFNLSVIEGYNHKEISKMLGIEEVSSRSNLSRAKQLLRKKLEAFKKNESWARIV